MKRIYTLLIAILITVALWGHSPEKMSYQAVVRNASNELVINKEVSMKISILQGTANGTPVYTEIFTPTTNANGLISVEIGGGVGFDAIDWSTGSYFIKTETDPEGGTSYTIVGISQLLSVPYALHAKTASTLTEGITETDPEFSSWDKSTGIAITESQVTDLQSYLTEETDPVFSAWDKSSGITINEEQVSDLQDYLLTESDPTVPSHVKSITAENLSQWNESYAWGDHSEEGYLTSYTESQSLSDVIAISSSANNQSITNLANPLYAQDAATKAYVDMLQVMLQNLLIRVESLEANSGLTLHPLTLISIPASSGSVIGAGNYEEGAEVTITATPAQGYVFAGWMDGVTDDLEATTTYTMPAQGTTLTANFTTDGAPRADGIVIDKDGNYYPTVVIGNQEWMAENLRTTTYLNGDEIPTGISDTDWDYIDFGAYAIYPHTGGEWPLETVDGINSDAEMIARYGALYNWYAVADDRGLCPIGWVVPTTEDWATLIDYLGGSSEAGGKLKCTRIKPDAHPRWDSPNSNATNQYGFSALPGGARYDGDGPFMNIGHIGEWWSSTENDASNSVGIHMYYNDGSVYLEENMAKLYGYAVRCLRHVPTLTLTSSPILGGNVSGGGKLAEGEVVTITATANPGYTFENWTGDTDFIEDASSATTTVTIPAQDITLSATFTVGGSGDGYGIVIDEDDNHYPTVIIGTQEWMAENLRTSTYNDGTPIPTGFNNSQWSNLTTGAYSIYQHSEIDGLSTDAAVLEAYGALYNWYSVETGNLCPMGWKVPSDDDWTTLIDYLDGASSAGSKLMSNRTKPDAHPRWEDTFNVTNDYDFSALPGGSRNSNDGRFNTVGHTVYWWSSTQWDISNAWSRFLSWDDETVNRSKGYSKRNGFSVRCLKN